MKRIVLTATALLVVMGTALAGTFPPADSPYYLRGGFNDWGTSDEMTWDAGSSTYSVNMTLDAGNYFFKMADDGWSNEVTIGNPGGALGTITPGDTTGVDLASDFGTDLNVDILTAGVYNFSLDLSGWSNTGSLDAFLSITAVPLPAAGFLFASGLLGMRLLRRRS